MLRRADREREFEGRALAGSAADVDGAAEFFDPRFDDVEADTAAGDC